MRRGTKGTRVTTTTTNKRKGSGGGPPTKAKEKDISRTTTPRWMPPLYAQTRGKDACAWACCSSLLRTWWAGGFGSSCWHRCMLGEHGLPAMSHEDTSMKDKAGGSVVGCGQMNKTWTHTHTGNKIHASLLRGKTTKKITERRKRHQYTHRRSKLKNRRGQLRRMVMEKRVWGK